MGGEDPLPHGLHVRKPAVCGGYPGALGPVLRPGSQPEHCHGPGHYGHVPAYRPQLSVDAPALCEKTPGPVGCAAYAGVLHIRREAGEPGAGAADVHNVQLLRLLYRDLVPGPGGLCALPERPGSPVGNPPPGPAAVLRHGYAEPEADLHNGAAHPGLPGRPAAGLKAERRPLWLGR